MKLFFCTTLLLAISFFTSSCKTKQDLVIKEHYQSVNKYSTLENKLLRDNNALLLSTSISKSNNQDYDNSVNLQMYQSQVNSSEYKVLYEAIVNGILQGILCWGVAVGINQTIKQVKKEE